MIKRICALLLACVCTCTGFAGATFTDDKSIQAKEAVEMLASMQIIGGYADGSYRPNATVTRGEMAKMIYTLCLGTSDAVAYKDIPTAFSDISGHWAAGYIKYCELNGILSGQQNARFSPDSKITGVETAKMLLVVMGYSPSKIGLTGADWQQKTASFASDAHLLDDVDCDITAPLPRQYAAQLLYNAINADCVQWSKDADAYDVLTINGKQQTVGTKYLKMDISVGTLVKVQSDSIAIEQNDQDETDSTATFHTFGKVPKDCTPLLGHRVRVLTKDGKVNQVLGVFETAGSTCRTVNYTDIEKNGTGIKCDGTKYDLDKNGVMVYDDGDYKATYTTGSSLESKQSPDQVILVDSDNDNDLDLALIQPYLVAKVTAVSKKTLKAGGVEYKYAEENIQSGLAVDDYVIITHNGYKDQMDIVKATFKSGKLTAVKGTKDPYDSYEIDGVWYTRAAKNYEMNSMKGGETVQYLVVNHVVFYTKSTSEVTSTKFSNVVMVLGLEANLSGNQAKILRMDGTTEIVTVRDSDQLSFSKLVKGNCYEFAKDNKGYYYFNPLSTSENYYSNYTAVDSALVSGWSGSSPSGGKPITKNSYKGVTLAPTAQVILYYAPNNRYEIISGNQYTKLFEESKSIIVSGGGLAAFMKTAETKKDKDTVYLMAVAINKLPSDLMENDHYGYLVSNAVKTSASTLSYNLWDGTEYHAVLEQIGGTKLTAKDRLRGMVIGYEEIESDGTIKTPVIYGTEGDGIYIRPLKAVDGKKLTYEIQGEDKTFTMSDSTKVLYVNSDVTAPDEIGVKSGTIQPAVTTDGYLYANTMMIPSGSDGVTLLVVDVDNKVDVPGLYVSVNTKKVSSGKTKATITGADSVMMGDSLTLTLTDSKGATKTITLKNAVFADTGMAIRTVTLTAKQKYVYTIVADGNGKVDLTLSE